MQQKVSTQDDDDAVSPVIGVILMVAITVILAAVIGTFVLGLGDQVQQEAQAGVNFETDGPNTNVSVTLTTLGNADYVVIRGGAEANNVGSGDALFTNTTGTSATWNFSTGNSGQLTAVAVIGSEPSSPPSNGEWGGFDIPDEVDAETTIQTYDYEF